MSMFSRMRSVVNRFREDDVAPLDVPPQHHLGRRLADLPRDLSHHRVVENIALRDRRPGLGEDRVVEAVSPHLVIGEIRVDLDLVDRGHGLGVAGEFLEWWTPKFDTPMLRARPSFLNSSNVCHVETKSPSVERRQRPVNEEQVDVVEAQRVDGSRRTRGRASSGLW